MRRDRTGPGGARPGRGGETEHLASPSLGATASLWALPGPLAWPNPASLELPCDISKEAFAQENISLSQSSLKAGWCPSNRLLLGLAAPARPPPLIHPWHHGVGPETQLWFRRILPLSPKWPADQVAGRGRAETTVVLLVRRPRACMRFRWRN